MEKGLDVLRLILNMLLDLRVLYRGFQGTENNNNNNSNSNKTTEKGKIDTMISYHVR